MMVLLKQIQSTVTRMVHELECCIEFLRERLYGFLGTHPVYKGLVYTEQEEKLIVQTQQILLSYFPESPGVYLSSEDYESRCEAIEDYTMALMELYHMNDVKIIVTDDLERFPDQGALFLYGYADTTAKKVYINANAIRSDDVQILEHIVSTVIHELRHMMQYRAAAMIETYGTSYERRHAWRMNMINYIEAKYDPEGYSKQPVEFDARNFTNRVWQGAYQS